MTIYNPNFHYTLERLLKVKPPEPPSDFANFWQRRYQHALKITPNAQLSSVRRENTHFNVHDLQYTTSDKITIHGWAMVPKHGKVERVIIVGHGYGGGYEPEHELPLNDVAYLFPCSRGLSKSQLPGVPNEPYFHVLYHINDREQYILGGCVEDIWLAVSAALELFPNTRGRIGLMGISFTGGLGCLALPWDLRIKRAHFQVPSFGHQMLRLKLPTHGSAHSVQDFCKQHPKTKEVLRYFDAATAAQFIRVPTHIAAALSDPVVTPPGQFCIYNALPIKRNPFELFVLSQGHADYPDAAKEQTQLLDNLRVFFADL
ncbi:MAG: deacetylase [Alteromonadaceae bacterium]|nr:MAG: deacetylase [Alteromonadaceae bacterium]